MTRPKTYQHRQSHSTRPSIVSASLQSGRWSKPHWSDRCTGRRQRGARFACESGTIISYSTLRHENIPVASCSTYLQQIHGVHHRVFLEMRPSAEIFFPVDTQSRSPATYRNPCESTREHVPAEAIVGREGFVAVGRDTELACTAHRGTPEKSKIATGSHRERAGTTQHRQHRITAPQSSSITACRRQRRNHHP